MYERTRRRWLMRAFAAFCLAPTVAVVGFCAVKNRPGLREEQTQRLEAVLGLRVELDDYREPLPGKLRFDGLTLKDPETGAVVFRAARLDVRRQPLDDDPTAAVSVLVLSADSAELSAAGFDAAASLADRALRGWLLQPSVRIAVGRLHLEDNGRTDSFSDVQASIDQQANGSSLRACFRWEQSPEPARVQVVRHRQGAAAGYQVELDTRGAALPCRLLAHAWPAFAPCGDDATFRGCVWTAGGETPAADLAGELSAVDLGRLAALYSGYRFSGRANVVVRSGRIRAGRLEEGVFTLSAGPGLISRDLMEMLVSRLRTPRAAEPVHPGDLVSFEQLAFHAAVDRGGLRLHGCCAGAAPGALLCDHRGPLLLEPVLQPQPLAAVVQVLVPGDEAPLPVSRRAQSLARLLPLPDAQYSPDSLSRQPSDNTWR
mgnify:CR=1 FL=1